MPKPIHYIDSVKLDQLKKAVSIRYGLNVKSSIDCKKIASMMNKEGVNRLSSSTIYRFFFQPFNHKCYLDTLDKLSIYAGFKSWADFICDGSIKNKLSGNPISIDMIDKSLITKCILGKEYKALYNYLYDLPEVLEEKEKVRIGLAIYRGLFLNNNNIDFYKKFCKLPFMRNVFFEEFADPDFHIKDYAIGLGYYLENIDPHNSLAELQDYIFGNSLLFRYYFKSGVIEKAKLFGKKLYNEKGPDMLDNKAIHIFPESRYMSYKVLYELLFGSKNKLYQYQDNLLGYCENKVRSSSEVENKILFYNTVDTFLIAQSHNSRIKQAKNLFKDVLPVISLEKSLTPIKIQKLIEPNGLKRIFNSYELF